MSNLGGSGRGVLGCSSDSNSNSRGRASHLGRAGVGIRGLSKDLAQSRQDGVLVAVRGAALRRCLGSFVGLEREDTSNISTRDGGDEGVVVEEVPEGLSGGLGEVSGLDEGADAAHELDLEVLRGGALLHVLAEALEVAALELEVAGVVLGVDRGLELGVGALVD